MDAKKYLWMSSLALLLFPVFNYAGTMGAVSEDVNRAEVYGGVLFLQPGSDNLRYATFVEGQQPYFQNWRYLIIQPGYTASFEIGANYYFMNDPNYGANLDWIHLKTSDSDAKQANRTTDLSHVEFTAPTFEESPPVFGIKHVEGQANFAFDSILLNATRSVTFAPQFKAKFFGGVNILRVNQSITTTFGDYVGSPATNYSYALPPDPSYSMKLVNQSKYLGAGPNAGVSAEYEIGSGFGIVGQALGSLTVGTISAVDEFYGTSQRITALYNRSEVHQFLTSPTSPQVVPGTDGKLGVFYVHHGVKLPKVTIEAGYRIAAYLNAITTISPTTLVAPGTYYLTPEFATGTMALQSSDVRVRPFTFNGPYLNLSIAIA